MGEVESVACVRGVVCRVVRLLGSDFLLRVSCKRSGLVLPLWFPFTWLGSGNTLLVLVIASAFDRISGDWHFDSVFSTLD